MWDIYTPWEAASDAAKAGQRASSDTAEAVEAVAEAAKTTVKVAGLLSAAALIVYAYKSR